jgi:hypothetical protein
VRGARCIKVIAAVAPLPRLRASAKDIYSRLVIFAWRVVTCRRGKFSIDEKSLNQFIFQKKSNMQNIHLETAKNYFN